MGKKTDEIVDEGWRRAKEEWAALSQEERDAWAAQSRAGVERPSRSPGLAYRGERFDSLGDLLAAGLPVKIVLRDTGYGISFTVKVVFQLPKTRVGMYMHGTVKSDGMVPEVIDRLLQKGAWHRDRYYAP